MLKSEFREKYPNNPDEGNNAICLQSVNFLKRCHKLNNPALPHIEDIRMDYCKDNMLCYEDYMKDWRSIERINPKTKKFYKSSKYQ